MEVAGKLTHVRGQVGLKITGTTVHGHLHDGSGEHSAVLRYGVSSRREAGGGLEPGPLL